MPTKFINRDLLSQKGDSISVGNWDFVRKKNISVFKSPTK